MILRDDNTNGPLFSLGFLILGNIDKTSMGSTLAILTRLHIYNTPLVVIYTPRLTTQEISYTNML